MSPEAIGQIALFASRIGQRCEPLMGRNADDLIPFWLHREEPAEDALAHRVAVGKRLGRQLLIDNDAIETRLIIGFVELAPGNDRGAHSAEISRQNGFHVECEILAFVVLGLGRSPAVREKKTS